MNNIDAVVDEEDSTNMEDDDFNSDTSGADEESVDDIENDLD